MKQAKKLTISAMTVALGTMFMVVGAIFQVMDLTVAMLASLLVSFIYIELGAPYTYLVWLCTSLATFVLYPGSVIWFNYLILFGIYPILKGYIEKLKKPFWIPLKLVFCNLSLSGIFFGTALITGIPVISDMNIEWLEPWAMYLVLYLLGNLAFLLYDFLITMVSRFYYSKIRPKIEKILK